VLVLVFVLCVGGGESREGGMKRNHTHKKIPGTCCHLDNGTATIKW
jgi:hypothetical protein